MHGLEDKYAGQMTFSYLDIDDPDTQRFKQQLGYLYQPHLFLVDGEGNILQQWVGYTPGEVINAAIVEALP